MRFNLRSYLSLTVAAFRISLRSPVATFAGVVTAVVMIVVLNAISSRPGVLRTELVQATNVDPAFADLVKATPALKVSTPDHATAMRDLTEGRTDIVIVEPVGLGQPQADGRLAPASVSLLYNPARSSLGALGQSVVSQIVNAYNDSLTHARHVVTLAPRPVANTRNPATPELLVVSLLTIMLIQGGLAIGGGAFANYKTTGALRRIQGTPTDGVNFVLAHATTTAGITLIQVVAVAVAGIVVFDLRVDHPFLMAVIVVMGLAVFLGAGLAIAGRTSDSQSAGALISVIMLPLLFLTFVPPGELPAGVSTVVNVLPSTLATEGLRQAASQANVMPSLSGDLLALGVWAVAALLLAILLFRWE